MYAYIFEDFSRRMRTYEKVHNVKLFMAESLRPGFSN
jgi:hypothetical protein